MVSNGGALEQVRRVLESLREDGVDPAGVELLIEIIDGRGRRRSLTASSRELTRAECVQEGCPWVNSDQCRYGHPTRLRVYALIGEAES